MTLRRRTTLIVGAVLAVGLAALVTVALGGGFDTTVTERVSGGGTRVVHVALVDATLGLAIRPNVITVDRGTRLVLDVENEGGEAHDLAVAGGTSRTRMLGAGESQRLDLGTTTTTTKAWCTLPGHKLAGMTLTIEIAAPAPDSRPIKSGS